jgi:hypothetical protein
MHKGLTTALATAAIALAAAAAPAGAELLPVDTGDGGGEIEATVCGQGVLKECGSVTSRRCTQWLVTSIGGSVSILPTGGTGGVNGTVSCASWTETTTKLYKDRYKTKTA